MASTKKWLSYGFSIISSFSFGYGMENDKQDYLPPKRLKMIRIFLDSLGIILYT